MSDYDPEWPTRYARWHAVLKEALGDAALRIEHVGSTSVTGLPAKPIIDVQVSVGDLASGDDYVPLWRRLAYNCAVKTIGIATSGPVLR